MSPTTSPAGSSSTGAVIPAGGLATRKSTGAIPMSIQPSASMAATATTAITRGARRLDAASRATANPTSTASEMVAIIQNRDGTRNELRPGNWSSQAYGAWGSNTSL